MVRHVPEQGPTLYIKRQEGHIFRSFRYPFGRPTSLREAGALEHFRAIGLLVPTTRFFGIKRKDKWHAVLVTETLPQGFVSLDNLYPQTKIAPFSPTIQNMLIEKLATTLARLHMKRWQHSSLMPKHIFVRYSEATADGQAARVEVAFLDLERARKQFSSARAARRDLRFMRSLLTFWSEQDWMLFDQCYRRVFGRKVQY